MKPLSFECPYCNQHIEADPGYAGHELNCPTCGKGFVVPRKSSPRQSVLKVVFEVAVLMAVVGLTVFVVRGKLHERAAQDAAEREFLRDINPEKFEDASETKARLRAEAEAVVRKECSNYLGFSRVMDTYVDCQAEQVTNWHGEATVDFLNKQGGMERTNLLFRFFLFEHHCLGGMDEAAMWDRQEKERARRDAFQRQLNQ
jgi:predicted RNA-binding Zn-ribbon protein involved in translation (DUF1610 family)